MNLTPGMLWGLRRMADERGIFKMTAVDQRPPIKGPISKHLGVEQAPWDQVARFKGLLVETLQAQSTAMLLDPHFAIPHSIGTLSPTKGLIITLEDSVFQETSRGRLSSDIDDWSVGKIKRMGGDAVKVLAWYRPDAGCWSTRWPATRIKPVNISRCEAIRPITCWPRSMNLPKPTMASTFSSLKAR